MTTEQKINIDTVFSLIYKNDKYIETNSLTKAKEMLQIVSNTLNLKIDDLKSHCRNRDLVDARKIYTYLIYRASAYEITIEFIGSLINRKHPAICFYIKTTHELIERDKHFSSKYYKCLDKFNQIHLLDTSFDNIPQY